MGGAKAHYDGIVAFSQTDFTEDLKKITVPVLVMHSEDDQIVPYVAVRAAVREAVEEWNAENLQGFPARHAHYASGDDQRRSAGVLQELGSFRFRRRFGWGGVFLDAEGFADVLGGSAERMARVAIALVERVAAGVLSGGEGVVLTALDAAETASDRLPGHAADSDDSLLGMLALIEPGNLRIGKFAEPRKSRGRKVCFRHFGRERPCG